MLVRNYKGMARNKKHLVEAASQRQPTRSSLLANKVDCEVGERNSMLVRNYKVQQSISLRRSNRLAKNCKVVRNSK